MVCGWVVSGWLLGCLVAWLVGCWVLVVVWWLVGWLAGWLVVWLVGWSVIWLLFAFVALQDAGTAMDVHMPDYLVRFGANMPERAVGSR